jgi:4-amino-4-deoxy-L-arabinose transferase-like glycosyltransferase
MKKLILISTLLFCAYLATRFFNLTKLPIFTDEAIYIRWSQIGMRDANWRFISLTDGKQPMFTWIVMILLRFVHGNPLFVGRLASVIAGIGTMIGLWFLAIELFKSRTIAFCTIFLYIISPFTLWYDRMALYDSMVSMFSIWNLWLAIKLVRSPRLDISLILGMTLGAGMLNKSSGFLSLYLLPFTLMLFNWHAKNYKRQLFTWVMYIVLACVLSQIFYSVLRLSPFFYIIGQKDNVFLFSLQEWLDEPFRFFIGNLKGMLDWTTHYLTLPIFYMSLLPLFFRDKKQRERLLLYIWWIFPFIALAGVGKVLYPRFILFMTIPLYIMAVEGVIRVLDLIKKPLVSVVFVLIVCIPSVTISYKIITDPLHAPIPISDRLQYIEDWPSGWGVPQIVSFLDEQAKAQKISVYTEGTFGLFPYALEIYLVENPNITITGLWPLPAKFPEMIAQSAVHTPTFVVLNQSQTVPSGWPLTLIGQYRKGTVDKFMRLYRVDQPLAAL